MMDRKDGNAVSGSGSGSGDGEHTETGGSPGKVVSPFTEQVVDIIRSIPPGKVMTYGQIAACAGNPRGARQVVRILHSLSGKLGLPWHRVINAKGEIGLPEGFHRELQLQALESEGITVWTGGRVDLELYRHEPEPRAGQ